MKRMTSILQAIESAGTTDEKIAALKEAVEKSVQDEREQNESRSKLNVEEIRAAGHDGSNEIRIKVYRPGVKSKAMPCVYHIHGGGMILGGIDGEDDQMQQLSDRLESIVTNVEYRLAPENPYPAGVEDCYAGLQWVFDHAGELMVDQRRIGIMGESAGGGLAAAIALMARDRGHPRILFQCLVSPMLDDRNITPSSKEFSGVWPLWTRELNILGWKALLGNLSGAEVPEYAAPSRARNLANLPPSYIETGQLEGFRDEDVEYALRMMRSQVPVELHVYPGAYHSWYADAPGAALSVRAFADRTEWMKRQFMNAAVV